MLPRPTLTEADASLRQAHAGIRAREAAAALGGDPEQIASLMRCVEKEGVPYRALIGGIGLHGPCLAVSIAGTTLSNHPGVQGVAADNRLVVARIVAMLHDPVEAHLMLTKGDAEGLVEFDRMALELCGGWDAEEINAFTAYYRTISKPPAAESAPPGKRPRRQTRTR